MSENLWIIIDTSGSMLETGKRFIVRTFVRQVEQYIRYYKNEINLKLVSVNDEIEIIDEDISKDDYPQQFMDCKGKFDAIKLIDKLKQASGKFLLITDGFSLNTYTAIKNWEKGLQKDVLRVVKIGEDISLLEKSNKPEDIFQILDNWI